MCALFFPDSIILFYVIEYNERYPNGYKKIYYKRVVLELFAPYLNDDGVIKRLTMYENLNHTNEMCCWQWYRNREDSLETIEKDFETNQIIENYMNGRTDSLRCKYPSMLQVFFVFSFCCLIFNHMPFVLCLSTGFTRSIERDGEKVLEYYENSRLDGLLKLEVATNYVREYYEYRQDRFDSIQFIMTMKMKYMRINLCAYFVESEINHRSISDFWCSANLLPIKKAINGYW